MKKSIQLVSLTCLILGILACNKEGRRANGFGIGPSKQQSARTFFLSQMSDDLTNPIHLAAEDINDPVDLNLFKGGSTTWEVPYSRSRGQWEIKDDKLILRGLGTGVKAANAQGRDCLQVTLTTPIKNWRPGALQDPKLSAGKVILFCGP